MIPAINVNKDSCSRCGICVEECPARIFVQVSKDSLPEVPDPGFCIECGHCAAICPSDAVIHTGFPHGSIHPINQQDQPSQDVVLELVRTRRSARVFQDKPVERQQIEKIIEAARFAPTAHNHQTTGYIVVQDRKILDELTRAAIKQITSLVTRARNPLMKLVILLVMGKKAGYLLKSVPEAEKLIATVNSGVDSILRNAPALILFHADERVPLVDANAQLAIQNAALMAHSMGLGSFYTGFILMAFQRDKSIWPLVKLPAGHMIYGGLAIGYPRYKYKKWMDRMPPAISWL